MKNYYELLEIAASATADDVKRAFRAQIAKYHPDKVQHLGGITGDTACSSSRAHRGPAHPLRRGAGRDASVLAGGVVGCSTAPAAAPAAPSSRPSVPPASGPAAPTGPQFRQERATRDEFVRKATIGRLRVARESVGGSYDEAQARGFDIARVPKKKLFSSNKNPRMLGRFVSTVDREAVADAWAQAAKWAGTDEACVLLMGTALAPAGDLATEIGDQRRRHGKGGKLVLIPVDARDWEARMPLDAPQIAKTLLAKLKSGT